MIESNENIELMKKLTNDIQELINIELMKFNNKPPKDHTLSQGGFYDGSEIVNDYIDHNECGIALEHLLYMASEGEVYISLNTLNSLYKLSNYFEIDINKYEFKIQS
jgi:hypothetical protein